MLNYLKDIKVNKLKLLCSTVSIVVPNSANSYA